VLMPMGAVILVDFWLAGRLGFEPEAAARRGIAFNWAAAVAWLGTVAVCVVVALSGTLQIYFVGLPGWFLAAGLYITASRLLHGPRRAGIATAVN